MQNLDPKDVYNKQIEQLSISEKILLQRKKLLSWLRFFSLILSFITLWQLWPIGIAIAFIAFIILMGLFLFLVVKDLKNKDEAREMGLNGKAHVRDNFSMCKHINLLKKGIYTLL